MHTDDCADRAYDAEGRRSALPVGPEPGPFPVYGGDTSLPRRRRTPTSPEGVRPPVVTSKKRREHDRRTYVLDTSVLLALSLIHI